METLSPNIKIEDNGFVDKKSFDITPIPGLILEGGFYKNPASSLYTQNDDMMDGIIFNTVEVPRFIDMEKELRNYEDKYKMKSDEFYRKWQSDPSFDRTEFNKWVDLYNFLDYGDKN